jgi:hypothetical protein
LFRSWGGCFARQRPLSISSLSLLHIIKDPIWLYVVVEVLKPDTYKLANEKGELLTNAWNIQ